MSKSNARSCKFFGALVPDSWPSTNPAMATIHNNDRYRCNAGGKYEFCPFARSGALSGAVPLEDICVYTLSEVSVDKVLLRLLARLTSIDTRLARLEETRAILDTAPASAVSSGLLNTDVK